MVYKKGEKMKIEINDWIINKIRELYPKHGYDLPETEEGIGDIIEDLLIDALENEFGKL